MIVNQTPYPISFEREISQALTCRYGEEMRQYIFKPDINVSGLSCLLQIAKPDGTFTENGVEVRTDPDTGECTLVLTIPTQATVVKGLAQYSICCYGEVETETHLLYSAEGPLWVDDDLITEEMIQSVAEVNGYTFPQDFFTVDMIPEIVNQIISDILDDDTTSETTTWSSTKIQNEIDQIDIAVSETATGNPIELTNAASAPIVKCVTEITGSQDLHGYDKPWVGGAGKNKIDEEYSTNYSNVVQFPTGTYYFQGFISGISQVNTRIEYSADGENWTTIGSTPYSESGISMTGWSGGYSSTTGVFTGTIITTVTLYFRVYKVNGSSSLTNRHLSLSTTQLTSWEPYSNICPITAYTENTISVGGENRVDTSGTDTSKGYVSNSYLGSDGVVNSGSTWRVSEYFSVYGGEVYDLSNLAGNAPSICFYDDNKIYISGVAYGNSSTLELTTPSNAKYARLSFNTNNKSTIDIRWKNAPTHTTTYPSAIYRGSEDVVNGEVTKEWAIVDASDLTWMRSTLNRWYVDMSDIKYNSDATVVPAIISSNYATMSMRTLNNSEDVGISSYQGKIYIRNGSDATPPTGQIAYELATPTTSSVTPTNLPIKSLSGYNHIESSTGDMEVEYISGNYQALVDLIQSSSHVYSTAEQVVGKWIDGKVLYETTVVISSLPSSIGTMSQAHNISDISEIVESHGQAIWPNGESAKLNNAQLSGSTLNGPASMDYSVDKTDIYISVGTPRDTLKAYITIRYTKTS